ncbi:hypothetical protein N657DRAFT_651774 [Parathielavia appendiculata]|uniref:Uncharacterized protein n=1 Tax=Parathielavia appendiculata TaxID=2587402 RepID=A0AAN6YY78_9PEZI|nr:hypothetical protein N657DRAFT_651774 [Parathielavia appendiculata]
MRRAVGRAVLSYALGPVDAKALKWSNNGPRWVPPQETLLGYMPSLGMEPPVPTATPPLGASKPRGILEARGSDDNTCGYVSGSRSLSVYCDATARCVYNSINSYIGCCADATTASACPIWTTCYDSTDRDSFTTKNGYTQWCGDSRYPYCATYLYQDQALRGFTLLGCAVAAGTEEIWFTPVESSTPTSPSTTTPTDPNPRPPPTTSTPPPPTPTPVGPIVGGVVGGFCAIALIVLGIWALMRHNKKQENAAATVATGAGTTRQPQQSPSSNPYQDPHMSQLPAQGYIGIDQPTMVRSPPPPPPEFFFVQGTSSPPQQQQQQQGGYPEQQQFGNVSPETQVGAAGYQQQKYSPPLQPGQQGGFGGAQGDRGYIAELPAERGMES